MAPKAQMQSLSLSAAWRAAVLGVLLGCCMATAAQRKALLVIDVQNCFLPPAGSLAVPGGQKVLTPLKRLLQSAGQLYALLVFSADHHPAGHISFRTSHPRAGRGAETVPLTYTPDGQLLTEHGRKAREDLVHVQQQLWPDHCMQGTPEAGLHPALGVTLLDPVQPPLWGKQHAHHTAGSAILRAAIPGLHDHDHGVAAPEVLVLLKGQGRDLDSYSAFFDNAHTRGTGLHEELHARGIKELHVAGLALDFCVKYTCLDARQLGYEVVLLGDATQAVSEQGRQQALRELCAAGVWMSSTRNVLSSTPQCLCASAVPLMGGGWAWGQEGV